MTTPPLRPAPERVGNVRLGAGAMALVAAFVLLPRPLAQVLSGQSYGNEHHLSGQVTAAFVQYWRIGQRALTPELTHLIIYWRWFHVVKAVSAIGLLVVLVLLASRIWKAYARTGVHASAWPAATGGVLVTILSVCAFALALANVQGTLAPFSSLMSLLPINSAHGELATVVGQVKQELAHYPSGSSGALEMIVSDFAFFHVVVAVISAIAAVVLIVLTITSWRTFSRAAKADRHLRRLFASLGLASVLLTALIAMLTLANTTAAAASPTAVLNFYNGTF